MDQREVSITIPIDQIPFVMRAIGYYPSEQEVGISCDKSHDGHVIILVATRLV